MNGAYWLVEGNGGAVTWSSKLYNQITYLVPIQGSGLFSSSFPADNQQAS